MRRRRSGSRVSEGVSAQSEAISASDAYSMWNILASIIKDATKDSFGVAIGTSKTHTARRESWWLCEEVQSKVAKKQARFKELLTCQEGNHEERLRAQERYKLAKREAKKAVAQAKEKAYEDLYKKLDYKEGANEIFRIAKARQRRRRDLGDIALLMMKQVVPLRMRKRSSKDGDNTFPLFSTRDNRRDTKELYYSRISQTEVRTAVQKMGRNKAVGPDQIPIEAWRSLGAEGINWLTSFFNKIFTSAKMPEEWRLSDVIPIFKIKGDAQERQGDTLRLLGICTTVRRLEFEPQLPSEVELHQGSTISPHLFALISDELSRGIQDDIPWCMIFADDIVLVSESAEGLNDRLENWREALEANGLRVSRREKTKYLRCDFSNSEIVHNEKVELKGKFYRAAIRPAMLYGSECWPITKALANRMEVAELRMLRRRPQSAPVRRVEALVVDGMRRRGRPKLRWEDKVKLDMNELLLSEDMISDRNGGGLGLV
uniref:Reverse transcriptase domain-containing protein n=1 Tax=Tanacetum cinerariifolium TaxID=118510 RepID=A0A6L2N994_TANCI|nr:hypothetical protein [Tanacetum cinerariifolium]